MDKRLAELHRERGQLIERIASQRMTLARQLEPLQEVAAAGDRAVSLLQGLVRYVNERPLPVLMVAAALVLFKPKSAWRWAQRGLFVWRTWRTLRTKIPQEVWRRWF